MQEASHRGAASLDIQPVLIETCIRRRMALVNLVLSPFLIAFLLIYFFLRHAEAFYHHPSSAGARRWSALAKWRLREFNELPHYITHRSGACEALDMPCACALDMIQTVP